MKIRYIIYIIELGDPSYEFRFRGANSRVKKNVLSYSKSCDIIYIMMYLQIKGLVTRITFFKTSITLCAASNLTISVDLIIFFFFILLLFKTLQQRDY